MTIALSAYASPRDRFRSVRAGFQEHVAKPVDPPLVQIVYERLHDIATEARSEFG